MEPLGAVLSQLSAGGGAASINIEAVTAQLEELTRRYPFQARALLAAAPAGRQRVIDRAASGLLACPLCCMPRLWGPTVCIQTE